MQICALSFLIPVSRARCTIFVFTLQAAYYQQQQLISREHQVAISVTEADTRSSINLLKHLCNVANMKLHGNVSRFLGRNEMQFWDKSRWVSVRNKLLSWVVGCWLSLHRSNDILFHEMSRCLKHIFFSNMLPLFVWEFKHV